MSKTLGFILPILLCISCFQGSDLEPDQDVWEYAQPFTVGLNQDLLLDLDSQIKDGVFEEIDGLLILKEDKLVFENYYDFSNRRQLRSIGRGTYTMILTMLGTLVEDGSIRSLEDPIVNYLPQYTSIFDNDSEKMEITISHLLNHKSGLVWNESIVSASSSESDLNIMKNDADWVKYVLEQPMEAPPGLRLVFNSGSAMILCAIMQSVLGETPLEEHFKEQLFDKIGIENYSWEKDPVGNLNGTNGLKLSSFDMLRFGQLILNEGRWVNKQRVFSEDWHFEITSIQNETAQYYNLAYGWWIFNEEFLSLNSFENEKILFINGEIGQNLYILPERNMVIMIQAENFYYNFFNPSLNLFIRIMESAHSAF